MVFRSINSYLVTAGMCAGLFALPGLAQNAAPEDQTSHPAATDSSTRNRSENGAKLTPKDQKFFEDAAQGGMTEVKLAQIAQEKATNDQVKQLAQTIEQDHKQANDKLKTIAEQKDVQMPSNLDAKHQAMVDKFSNLSGDQFDRQYAQAMVKDHKKDIAAFQRQANSGYDSDLKQFAQETVPTLQKHLQMAQSAVQATGSKMKQTSAKNNQ